MISINCQFKLLNILIVIVLFNPLMTYIFNYYALPNIVTYIKDLILLLLFYEALNNQKLIKNRNNVYAIFIIVWFIISYLTISIFDNPIYGLYYLRLYMQPLIAFFVCSSIIDSIDDSLLNKLIRLNIYYDCIIILAAFLMYSLLIKYPEILITFWKKGENIPTSFYIAGGLLRLGFPQSGPNSIGIFFALNIFLLISLIVIPNKYFQRKVWLYLLLLINNIGLTLTFSRSSLVLLLVCLITTLIITFINYHLIYLKYLRNIIAIIIIIVIVAVFINILSDGMVIQWIWLNIAFSDPSLVGHKDTFVDLFNNIYRYLLSGYPRGTVGPKAQLGGDMINAENSYMVLLYDCGLYLFIVLMMAYYFVIKANFNSKLQLPLLVGMLINISFLPTIFDVEIIIYAIMIYILLGKMRLLEKYSYNKYA